MTSYSSGVNGKNQAKFKEKSRVHHYEDVVLRSEDVRHGEGYCSPQRRESCLKYQSRVHHGEDVVHHNEDCCSPR